MTSIRRYGPSQLGAVQPGHVPGSLARLVALWRCRSRQRRALKKLDDRLLRDIGIGRIEAENELRKWFWQA